MNQQKQVLIKKIINLKKNIINKKRSRLHRDFDVETYKKLNLDISDFTNEEAIKHYINHGSIEGRKYKIELPNDFDVETYKKINLDVSDFTNEEAIKHYTNHGFFEERKYKIELPYDFDVETYKKINHDISDFTNEEAIKHYIQYGFFEMRSYNNETPDNNINLSDLPYDFDSDIYIEINNLTNYTHEEAKKHYLINGKEEGMKYKILNIESIVFNKDVYNKFKIEKIISLLENCDNETTNVYENKPIIRYNNKLDKYVNDLNNYNSIILIIDFPEHYLGGTNSFLNSIISKYKNNQDFLIVRNNNENFELTFNDDFRLNANLNENELIDFLKINRSKFIKIFVNHIIGYSKSFINFLFRMNKEITAITHDYSLIKGTENSQPYYHELCNNNDQSIINLFDKIITQNEMNIVNIENKLVENKNIIISELPDFKKRKDLVNTNNESTVVGIIGYINHLKGYKILDKINTFIKQNNLNIKIIIFGDSINKNIPSKEYRTINEFNDLLIKYKPNVLLEASIWPETYSYSLTLSMLTGLPILCFDKNFPSVIKNRLENYENKYYFEHVDNNLFELIEKTKQNYFFTVKPIKYYNSFWDNYFITNEKKSNTFLTDNKNIVLITSKIIVSQNPLIYVDKRSSYTPKERLDQTLETIKSIRKYIPDSYIILIDNSNLDNTVFVQLKSLVDKFINITFDETLNYNTDNSPYKGYGEVMQQITVYNEFLKFIDLSKINNFFKISGRYLVNENFDYDIYNNDKNIFKKNEKVTNRNYYYTSFYKLDKNFLHEYFMNLYKIMIEKDDPIEDLKQQKQFNCNHDIEVIIPEKIIEKITLTKYLGITQLLANKEFAKVEEFNI